MPLFAIILSDLIAGLTDTDTPPSEILKYAVFFWGLGIGNFLCVTLQVRSTAALPKAPSWCTCVSGVRDKNVDTLSKSKHTAVILPTPPCLA